MKRFVPLLIVVAALLSGCSEDPLGGSSSKSTDSPELTLASQNSEVPQRAARAVIRTGTLVVRVPDIENAERAASDWIAKSGGFVSAAASSGFDGTSPNSTMTLRTPANRFDDTIDYLESLGTRLSKAIKAEDVTTQLVDLDARIKTMSAQEESLRGMLAKSRKMSDTLAISRDLTTLRTEIESIAAKRKSTADQAAFSTIELKFVGEARGMGGASDSGWAKETWNGSTAALASFGRGLGSMSIMFLVFVPIWGPLVLAVWLLYRKANRPVAPPKFEM